MSRLLLFTLLVSITAHVAVAFYKDEQKIIQNPSNGSIKAPVSMTFVSVTTLAPKPQPKPNPVQKTPEPKPEPVVKKLPKSKPDVIKLAKPEPVPEVKEKPEKKPEIKKEVVKKQQEPVKKEPKPEKEVTTEPQSVRSATKEVEVEGTSNQPVFVAKPAIRKAPLRYPPMAKRRNYQGVVQLEVIIDRKGRPTGIKILESSGYKLLDKSAVSAVEDWEFEPQKINNRLVVSKVHIPVAFQLN